MCSTAEARNCEKFSNSMEEQSISGAYSMVYARKNILEISRMDTYIIMYSRTKLSISRNEGALTQSGLPKGSKPQLS